MGLELIVGCMYSGKTEELVRRLRREQFAGKRIAVFKPAIDDRYSETQIASHTGVTFDAIPVSNTQEVEAQLNGRGAPPHVIGFDEAQFMSPELIPLLESYADIGIRVLVAGLDQDYLGKPFGPIPDLLALADSVTKLQAVCVAKDEDGNTCGGPATRSYRRPEADSGARVQVGSDGVYEARCRLCWRKGQDGK